MKKKKVKIKNATLKRNSFLKKFIDVVNDHKNNLPKFNKCKFYKQKSIKTDSWFDITKTINKTKRYPVVESFDKIDECKYKQIKVKMILTDIHKEILQNWFKTTTLIYNEALHYIRENYKFTKKEIVRDILKTEITKSNKFSNKWHIRKQLRYIKNKMQKDNTIIIKDMFIINAFNFK